ncbi:helix-turn-helix domain-containing protein [Thioalkalivibrio nitratireducens]|nr:helix-turn-helix domain-containing protein [Thioalkalivibrio nitratireducens]
MAGNGTDPLPFSAEERRERESLGATLAAHHSNRTLAARHLVIDRATIWRKLHRLRLIPEGSR